jgi:hypothetical protein
LNTVLLTDGSFTGLIRTLREAYPDGVRIVGLSTDPYTAHQAILDSFYVITAVDAPEYLDELISILLKEEVDVIFPIVSEGLEILMENEELILSKTGARILSSALSAIQTANDKGLLYTHLKHSSNPELSSLIPEYSLANTKAALFDAIKGIRNAEKDPCIKRRRGEDADGFWIINDHADYASLLFFQPPSRMISEKALSGMLISLEDQDPIPPYMVCEFLPGEEWDCDVLCMDGTTLSVTTRINLTMTGGLTSVLRVSDNPFLSHCCELIVSALHLSYIVCISFRANADGQFFLLEINPRVMGNIYADVLSGNNYVRMAVDLLHGKPVQTVSPRQGIMTALYYDQLQINPKINM